MCHRLHRKSPNGHYSEREIQNSKEGMVGADQKARLKTIATKRSCEDLLCTSSGGVLPALSSRHSRGSASPPAPRHSRNHAWDQPAATGCFLLTQAFNYALSNCTKILSGTKLNFLHGRMELECSFSPLGAHRSHPERWHSGIHKPWRLTSAPVNASQS